MQKTKKHYLQTSEGYVTMVLWDKVDGQLVLKSFEYTDQPYLAELFNQNELERMLPFWEQVLGVSKGKGLGIGRFIPKKFVISTPNGYVFRSNLCIGGLTQVEYTSDLEDAETFDERYYHNTLSLWEDFLDLEERKGFSFVEVKLVIA